MRLILPANRFERHLAHFYLLHVGVPLKGEAGKSSKLRPPGTKCACHMPRSFLHSASVLTFTAGIRTPCISPRRAADGESSIPAHSSTPAQGTSSLESPSSSLFSKLPLSPVSANALVDIQSENVALPNRLQLVFYRKGVVRNKNSEQ